MYIYMDNLSHIPFSQYINLDSLSKVQDVFDIIDSVSFSLSPVQNSSQIISLLYHDGHRTYTLGWYDIDYDPRSRTTIAQFATANMRKIPDSYKTRSWYAAHIHLLSKELPRLGTLLFQHLISLAKQHNMPDIKISSDPQSVVFYQKMAEKFSSDFSCVKSFSDFIDEWRNFVFTLKYPIISW